MTNKTKSNQKTASKSKTAMLKKQKAAEAKKLLIELSKTAKGIREKLIKKPTRQQERLLLHSSLSTKY